MGRWIVSLLLRVSSLLIWNVVGFGQVVGKRIKKSRKKWLVGMRDVGFEIQIRFRDVFFCISCRSTSSSNVWLNIFLFEKTHTFSPIQKWNKTTLSKNPSIPLQLKQNKPTNTPPKKKTQTHNCPFPFLANSAYTHRRVVTLLEGLCLVYTADLRHKPLGNCPQNIPVLDHHLGQLSRHVRVGHLKEGVLIREEVMVLLEPSIGHLEEGVSY